MFASIYILVHNCLCLCLTFGGMCSWRRVAVARVFALVVRCRVKRLLLYSRVGKNRDTLRESPAGAGAACAAGHNSFLFSHKILAAQKPIAYTDLLCTVLIITVNYVHYYNIVGVYLPLFNLVLIYYCFPSSRYSPMITVGFILKVFVSPAGIA